MKKDFIVLKRPGRSDVNIPMVVLNFSYMGIKGKSGAALYTNLVQYFVEKNDTNLLPKQISDRLLRSIYYNDRQLIEIDDVIYGMKYELNNGTIFDPNYIRSYLRLLEAIQNTKKPEIVDKILKMLNE